VFSRIKWFFGNVYAYMTVLLICWGTMAAVSRLLMEGIDSYQLQFYLYGLAFLTLIPGFFLKRQAKLIKKATFKQWILLVGCASLSYLYLLFYTMALSGSTGETIVPITMLNYLYPVFIVIFSHPINGEKMTLPKAASTFVCFVGAYYVVTGGKAIALDASILGTYALALAASIAWGLFSVLGKRNTLDISLSNFIYIGIGFVFSTVALLSKSSFTTVSLRDFALLAWLSAANFSLSYDLWFRALRTASASLAANMSFLTPFVTVFFIALILRDTRIEAHHIIGLLLTVFGMGIPNWVHRQKGVRKEAL
jgi:drug/metabolite transporter (DMT)-like permease